MPQCPKCRQTIDSEEIYCPYCNQELKAFGHPGMTLYQATNTEYLCESCVYHQDDTCDYPKRPYAKTCILYQDQAAPLSSKPFKYQLTIQQRIKGWCQNNQGLLVLMSLIAISLILTLFS
jgi:hypothetical protein